MKTCRAELRKLRNEGIFTPPSVQGTLLVPGNLGGMNWSGYAFDPQRSLLIVNTNNFIARVRLIPRDKVNSDREDGIYGAQRGTPYGMLRRFLQSPSDLLCGAPPWGTLIAVDMEKGTIRWRVPLGSMQNFGGAHGAVPPGSISLAGLSPPQADLFSSRAQQIRIYGHSTWKRGNSSGMQYCPLPATQPR